MKILLSAFACDPERGSEPGVGWKWAIELSGLGHEVCVLTTTAGQQKIERVRETLPPGLRFEFFDGVYPHWLKNRQSGFYLYYMWWQFFAYLHAKKMNCEAGFDVVQHITYGAFRYPSFMMLLGIPFIFGPVGGGERAPMRLRRSLRWKPYLLEAVRDLSNALAFVSPTLRWMYRRAALIVCKTRDTMNCIPGTYRSKCIVALEIGAGTIIDSLPPERPLESEFSILYVGRLHHVKGLHLALPAFAEMRRRVPSARLTIVGKGAEEKSLRELSVRLGIAKNIDWIPWMDREEVLRVYPRHDVLLFPSLHDSSGNAVLEALGNGLPVVCLDLGGPATLVNESCGRIVGTERKSEAEVAMELARHLEAFALSPRMHLQTRKGAIARAREVSVRSTIERIYAEALPQTEEPTLEHSR